MIVETRHDVRAAADERLQRLRAAGEILEVDVEALLLVETQLLRQRRRQVHHLVLPTDREPYRRAAALRAPIAAARPKEHEDRQGRNDRFHDFQRSSHCSNRVTPALAMTTTTASTVIPAKTPVVSNVPSACEIT